MAVRAEPVYPVPWYRGRFTSWITTVDHKRIGIPYLVTCVIFFGAGGIMAVLMLAPPKSLVRTYRVPRRVLWRTYVTGASARREAKDAVAKPRRLCVELGLVGPITRQLWRTAGIWAA